MKIDTVNSSTRRAVFFPVSLLVAALLLAAALAWRASWAPSTAILPSLPGFHLVTDAEAATVTPQLSAAEADTVAVNALGNDRTHFSNYQATESAFVPGLRQVTDHVGRVWYKTDVAEDDHVMFFTAPSQAGWKYVAGLVLVNDTSGKIESYQVRYGNSPDQVMP